MDENDLHFLELDEGKNDMFQRLRRPIILLLTTILISGIMVVSYFLWLHHISIRDSVLYILCFVLLMERNLLISEFYYQQREVVLRESSMYSDVRGIASLASFWLVSQEIGIVMSSLIVVFVYAMTRNIKKG